MFKKKIIGIVLASSFLISSVHAGPFILAGTDADDHGSTSGGANIDGWFFMQRALENLSTSSSLSNGFKTVANLGSSGKASNAASSAFNSSSLPGSGWNFANIDGDAAITDFFNGSGAININNTGIIMMDSGSNVTGGSSTSERGIFTTNAVKIDNFLGAGGGLFSQSNGYDWVTSLLPTLNIISGGGSGISLTAAGNAAFPGLVDSDLSAGPRHNRFGNTGSIPVLAVDNNGTAVIIGSAGGSVTNPDPDPIPVPAPATLALLGIGLIGIASTLRRKNFNMQ
ncbi:PEP-CTERM protein-sorting domain-containing protein [Nitrosomonas aestuarii]|uniref:PEP-CTERM protein-sorting domain-containing protein n=1 Tax=Nitrosomonas aestuarii TaxID=52441 RepID=A0A1I4BHF2_9PROT|nr:PEP-CTERM sorting domain-containing protein [Nitrosomonas aestuarii]SFK68198.1 PEP-CTERM protein-sorting domain-containing protein [Nitrosomonas aestuarii]